MPTLTKTTKVLHFSCCRWRADGALVAVYTHEPDEPGDTPVAVELPDADYLDLDEPASITVTIVPGDTLNT